MRSAGFLFLLMLLGSLAPDAMAKRPFTIKLATVAPKGSIYHRVLQEMGQEWRAAQGEGARFIIYTDSSQGSEADNVRRLRVGQLQASMLSVVGLKEIEPSVVGLQFMPMAFRSWEELDYVMERLRPELDQKIRERGYEVLLWFVGGWAQLFSDRQRIMPQDFEGAKIFTWAGTKDQETIMKSIGYQPVVLDLNDILPAVQTGMVDVVPALPLWALVGQFFPKTPHMLKLNWAPIVAATVISTKTWNKMRPEARTALAEAAARAEQTLHEQRESADAGAIEAMQQRGLIVHEPTPEARQAWQQLVESVGPRIRGSLVPEETFDTVNALLADYRSQNP